MQFIELLDVNLRMLGRHQLQNAATATCVILTLRNLGIISFCIFDLISVPSSENKHVMCYDFPGMFTEDNSWSLLHLHFLFEVSEQIVPFACETCADRIL